ncbi:unnamed protein product [Prunus armeniaca]
MAEACVQDPPTQQLIQSVRTNPNSLPHYNWAHDKLYYKHRLFVPATATWRDKILAEFHSTPTAGHSGYLRTYKRIMRNFRWPGLKADVKRFVAACDTCQRNKYESIRPPGLLQPLPIPETIRQDIAMDFVEGLPSSHEKNCILVVVDRLSKYGHFVALKHPYTAAQGAQLFIKEIFRLHGLPRTIVSDRDPTFLSQFWTAFFQSQGTKLCHSSAYHPQSNGQTEGINPLAGPHSSHGLNGAVYGKPPPTIQSYIPGTFPVNAVDTTLQDRDTILRQLRLNLQVAQ